MGWCPSQPRCSATSLVFLGAAPSTTQGLSCGLELLGFSLNQMLLWECYKSSSHSLSLLYFFPPTIGEEEVRQQRLGFSRYPGQLGPTPHAPHTQHPAPRLGLFPLAEGRSREGGFIRLTLTGKNTVSQSLWASRPSCVCTHWFPGWWEVVFPPNPWLAPHLTRGLRFGECFELKHSGLSWYSEFWDPSVLKGKMNGLFRNC